MKGGPPLRGTCSAADRLVLADHRDPLGKPAPAEVADLDLHHVAPLEVLGLVTLPLELDDRLGVVLHQDHVVGVVAIVGGRPFGGKAGTVSRGLQLQGAVAGVDGADGAAQIAVIAVVAVVAVVVLVLGAARPAARHVIEHLDLLGDQAIARPFDIGPDAVAALEVLRPVGTALVLHPRLVVIVEGDLAAVAVAQVVAAVRAFGVHVDEPVPAVHTVDGALQVTGALVVGIVTVVRAAGGPRTAEDVTNTGRAAAGEDGSREERCQEAVRWGDSHFQYLPWVGFTPSPWEDCRSRAGIQTVGSGFLPYFSRMSSRGSRPCLSTSSRRPIIVIRV